MPQLSQPCLRIPQPLPRFELAVHLIPTFIFDLVTKQARLIGQAVGLIGDHMTTLTTQFAHLRFISLVFDHFVKWRATLWQNFDLGRDDSLSPQAFISL